MIIANAINNRYDIPTINIIVFTIKTANSDLFIDLTIFISVFIFYLFEVNIILVLALLQRVIIWSIEIVELIINGNRFVKKQENNILGIIV